MNKEELLKAIEQKRQEVRPTDTGEMKPATVPNNLELGWLNALAWMKEYINSLPAAEEQPSGELDIEINLEYKSNYKLKELTLEEFRKVVYHFANWQKQQMLKSAVDGCYIKRNGYTQVKVLNGFSTTCEAIQKFKDGDKVKILVIKEDEQ